MTAVKSGMQGAVQHVGSADALIKKSLSWVKQQCLGGKGVSGEKLDERALSKLRWRCRRGLLENDLFIERLP